MSRGDAWSVSATLIAAAIGYWVGGPTAAWICLIAGLLIAVILHFTRPKKEEEKKPEPVPTVGVNDSFNPQFRQEANPNIHLHIGETASKPISLPVQTLKEQEEDAPNVSYVQARSVLLQENDFGVFQEVAVAVKGEPNALVAQFKNLPREKGKHTPKASSVTANLVFRNPSNLEEQEIHVSHGAWLGRYEHSATFYSGDLQNLIVAFRLPTLTTVENPNSSNPFAGRFRYGGSIRHPQRARLPREEGEVTITLVDGFGYTVFDGLFNYRLSKEEMSLTPRISSK